MRQILNDTWTTFWEWYERHLVVHTIITTILFSWQLIHLYWLTTHVVAERLIGISFFQPSPFLQFLIVIADYGEVPALLSASLLYINGLRKKTSLRDVSYLLLVNSQWLHLFWITDEFVIETFTGDPKATVLPLWLAWLAISIDYLELPVIYDTLKRARAIVRNLL